MLDALERRAGERGHTHCRLNSTETALRFYLAKGYSQDGPGVGKFGTNLAYPMSKELGRHPCLPPSWTTFQA